MYIVCKACGEKYDTTDLIEKNNLTNSVSILCLKCREHLIDVEDIGYHHKFQIIGIEAIEKTVASGNNSSARINVPPSWQGKRAIVVRLE